MRVVRRRKDDGGRLLEGEAEDSSGDGIEMADLKERDPEKLSTHVTEGAPMSYVNIAFGQESEEEDELEGEGEVDKEISLSDGVNVKLSPQR